MLVVKAILTAILVIILGLLYGGIARKVTARVHRRYGPPFYQNFIDVIKLFSKRLPSSHGVMFELGPVMAFGGMLVSLMFLPVGRGNPLFTFEGDLFVLLYLIVVAPLGMALGAGQASNPNATIGIARGLTLMIGYEFVFFVSVLPIIKDMHTVNLFRIAMAQSGSLSSLNAVKYPFSFAAALISMHAMLGEKPFDQTVAPHEIASGPMVEYGGKFLGLLQLYHAIAIIVETGLVVTFFLGGFSMPVFFLLTFVLFIMAVIVNTVMPRFRIFQAVQFFFLLPLVLAVINIIINAG